MKKTDSIATLDLLADNLGEGKNLSETEKGIKSKKTSDLITETG